MSLWNKFNSLPHELRSLIIQFVPCQGPFEPENLAKALIMARHFNDIHTEKKLLLQPHCKKHDCPNSHDAISHFIKSKMEHLACYYILKFPYRAECMSDRVDLWVLLTGFCSDHRSKIVFQTLLPHIDFDKFKRQSRSWGLFTMLPSSYHKSMMDAMFAPWDDRRGIGLNRQQLFSCLSYEAVVKMYEASANIVYRGKVLRDHAFKPSGIRGIFSVLGAVDDVRLCDWWIATFGRHTFTTPRRLSFQFKSQEMRQWYKDNGFV